MGLLALFYIGQVVSMAIRLRFVLRFRREPNIDLDTWKMLQNAKKEIYSPLIALTGLFVLLELLRWYFAHSVGLLQSLVENMGQERAHVIAGMAAFGVGSLAVWYKRYDQRRYGLFEIAFGTVGGGVATAYISVANFYATVMSFIGCMYVVTRGIENMFAGRSADLQKQKDEKRILRERDAFHTFKADLQRKLLKKVR
jgi:hypothetical protein